MDEHNLDEMKKETEVDNSRLEELIKQDITPQMQREVFEQLKEARLFLPVDFGLDAFQGIENTKSGDVIDGPGGFNIQFLTDENGNRAVPLFTSEEMMQTAGVHTSVMVMYTSDLANMLKQTERYSVISINPFTEFGLNMPIGAFLNLFEEPIPNEKVEALKNLLDFIKEHSIEIDENATLFLRSDENIMVDNAVDGVFIPKMPFYVSSNPKQGEGLKYTNILLIPKSKRFLPIGPDEELDIIIAPGTEFKLEDVLDETQNLWMCGAQPFYDD